MWKCHKCGKPVYFAERKQSLGYDWHPECLRCEECGKRLNPGLHAEHKGVPYCHVPCYGALFGPQLFGHGTRVESHKSFGDKQQKPPPAGVNGPPLPRDHIESKLRVYNQYYKNGALGIRSREVNERLVLEGPLRVSWAVQGMIHLKEDDDQRTVITVRKRNSCRYSDAEQQQPAQLPAAVCGHDDDYYHDPEPAEEAELDLNGDEPSGRTYVRHTGPAGDTDSTDISLTDSMSYGTCRGSSGAPLLADDQRTSAGSSLNASPDHPRSYTLPGKMDDLVQWDELDELLQVERRIDDAAKPYQTMPTSLSATSLSTPSSSSAAAASAASGASTTPDDSSRTLTQDFRRCLDLSGSSAASTSEPNGVSSSSSSATTTSSGQRSLEPARSSDGDDEFATPCSTLKHVDFDMFRQQVAEEYMTNSQQLATLSDGTLRSRQPIDPSRINDSLKIYTEQQQSHAMSKSFCGGSTYSNGSHSNGFALQKSGSAAAPLLSVRSDDSAAWLQRGLNRSRSGPNWFDANGSSDSDATLKPSTIRKNQELHAAAVAAEKQLQHSSTAATLASSPSTCTSLLDSSALSSARTATSPTSESLTVTSAAPLLESSSSSSGGDTFTVPPSSDPLADTDGDNQVILRRPAKQGSTAIKRRSGNKRSRAKLKRRCSINGHFYNRETSFFTPPHGSTMSVWVTSLVNTSDVIQLLLEKYKVDSLPSNFALYVVRDNGEQRRLRNDEYPLVSRIMMGPHEEVARLFLMDAQSTTEISSDVAQYLNLSLPECRAIIDRFNSEHEREEHKIRNRYAELRERILQRMDSLKVRL